MKTITQDEATLPKDLKEVKEASKEPIEALEAEKVDKSKSNLRKGKGNA